MKEFVYGTEEQYTMLKERLRDHKCHIYHCKLPSCCSKSQCRIGFEMEGDTYAIFIDKGIQCRKKNTPFREWLSLGTLRFLDYTDVKDFLRNLKSLY